MHPRGSLHMKYEPLSLDPAEGGNQFEFFVRKIQCDLSAKVVRYFLVISQAVTLTRTLQCLSVDF